MLTDVSKRRNEMVGRGKAPSKKTAPADGVTLVAGNGLAREIPDGNIPGAHGGRLSDIQRSRILTAMVQEVAVRGAGHVTVAHAVARSGVSRRTFYELFEDREDCLLAALEDAVARVAGKVVPAYESAVGWREGVRAALIELLAIFDSEPNLARLLAVESLGAGPRALERRRIVLDRMIVTVDEGRGAATKAGSLAERPSLTAEGIVGAVLAVLHRRVLDGGCGELVELTSPLMGMIVLPYLGPAAARGEIERPIPKVRPKAKVVSRDPLRDLGMRLTYRTIRVLLAVAAYPGSSNRLVGESAGIPDQGQASKLLARLHGLGLVENAGAGLTRGEPNAWTLTDKGWEVHGAIAQQMSSP